LASFWSGLPLVATRVMIGTIPEPDTFAVAGLCS
jgi:hypothetical protein